MTSPSNTRNPQSPLRAVARSPHVAQCLRPLEIPAAFRKLPGSKPGKESNELVPLPEWVEQYAELNAIDVLASGDVRIGNGLTDLAVLALQMGSDAQRIHAPYAHDKIARELELWLKRRRQLLVDEKKADVAFVAKNAATEQYCELLLGSRDYPNFDLYVAGIKHFVWQVKRKLFGNNITDPLMPILYGKQGMCKSVFTEHLSSPLKDLSIAFRLDELTDGRGFTVVQENYVIVLDELEKAQKADIESLKSLISGSQSSGRMMRSNSVVKVRNNATLIGTTNKPVSEMIRDSSGMRRFMQIDVPEIAKQAAADNAKRLLDFDVVQIWQGINENDDSAPIAPFRQVLDEHQKTITASDIMGDWLEDLKLIPNGSGAVRTVIATAVLFERYKAWLKSNNKAAFTPSGSVDFGRKIAKYLEHGKTSDGQRGYVCARALEPIGNEDLQHHLLGDCRAIIEAIMFDERIKHEVRRLIEKMATTKAEV
jgi:hypothetical protein